ncbi:MAG TPA: hypothetical protein VFP61_06360 [Acidimicrobiales bacterium]|nr:hypothetical protein [Acidimicrobiales bacterium]
MTGTGEIVVVCTANRCRSPMAAELLRRALADRPGAPEVSSAGFGPPDQPPLHEAAQVLRAEGLDISGHRSRRVDAALLGAVDLVVCMTRQHLVDLVVLAPAAWGRTFTLVELVERAERAGVAGAAMPLERWVAAVHGLRSRQEVMAYDRSVDVPDPVGQPMRAFEATFDRLQELVARLVAALPAPPPG